MTDSGSVTLDTSTTTTMAGSQAVILPAEVTVYDGSVASAPSPFTFDHPNADTIEALRELERGEGQLFESIDDLFADLNCED
jgi:hypothetical protein